MNEELKNKIRAKIQEGKKKVDIAKELGVSTTTVNIYSTDEKYMKYKERANSDEYKKRRKKYNREYMKSRYEKDPEFRERIKKHQKKYREKQKVIKNEDN